MTRKETQLKRVMMKKEGDSRNIRKETEDDEKASNVSRRNGDSDS